jgi:hypothetical protein
MKKLLLLGSIAILGLGSMRAQAQTFEFQAGDTSRSSYSGADPFKVTNRVRATGANPIRLEWRYLAGSSSIPSSWGFDGVCDNIGCYPVSTIGGGAWMPSDSVDNSFTNTSGSGYLLGDENDFHAQFSNLSTAANGTAVVRVEVRDRALPTFTRTITFIGTKGTSGISTYRTDDNVVLYPNPASESVNVLFDERTGVKNIAIYNLIGQPVSVFHVNGNSANLPLGDAPAGVYFARLLDANGRIVATRRFTRQ